jgi:hypothetical protein
MVSVRGRSVTELMASTAITEVASNLVDDVVNPCTFSSAAVPHWADVLVPSPSIPVTEAQWGTIEPHLPRGSLQAGGARVSNRDVVEGSSGLDDRRAVARISATDVPPDRPVDAAWTGKRMLPAGVFVGRLSRPCSTPRPAPVGEDVHGWLDCLGKEGPPTSV